jgi:hypothetical protein
MIDFNGQVVPITLAEIVGAYEIANIQNGHPNNIIWR